MDIAKVNDKVQISNSQVSGASAAGHSKNLVKSDGATGSGEVRKSSGPGQESVKLSSEAQMLSEAKEVVRSGTDVRADKVAALKKAIKDGHYKVDAGSISEKMIQSSLEEDLLGKKV